MATCSFCPKQAVSSHLVRVGKLPESNTDPEYSKKDKTRLKVVRVCSDHKGQVPR